MPNFLIPVLYVMVVQRPHLRCCLPLFMSCSASSPISCPQFSPASPASSRCSFSNMSCLQTCGLLCRKPLSLSLSPVLLRRSDPLCLSLCLSLGLSLSQSLEGLRSRLQEHRQTEISSDLDHVQRHLNIL